MLWIGPVPLIAIGTIIVQRPPLVITDHPLKPAVRCCNNDLGYLVSLQRVAGQGYSYVSPILVLVRPLRLFGSTEIVVDSSSQMDRCVCSVLFVGIAERDRIQVTYV